MSTKSTKTTDTCMHLSHISTFSYLPTGKNLVSEPIVDLGTRLEDLLLKRTL